MEEVHQTSASLGRAYQALQTAYIELAQLEAGWPDSMNEYLYEETYRGHAARTFIRGLVLQLEPAQFPLQELANDVQSLSSDLIRVQRGDGFRV